MLIAIGIIIVGIIIIVPESKDSNKQVIQSAEIKDLNKQVIQSADSEILCKTNMGALVASMAASMSQNFETKQASRNFVDRVALGEGFTCSRISEGTDLIIIKSVPISSDMQIRVGNYTNSLLVKLPTGFTAWIVR